MKQLILSTLALVALASCSKTDEATTLTTDAEVRISSSIATRTIGDTWEIGDTIGVYMTTNGGTTDYDLGTNVPYTTATTNGDYSSSTPLYYPASGTVDFLAYYPYSDASDFDITAYPLDVTTQSNQGDIDLMSASVTSQAKTSGAVIMTFDHKLSRIELTIEAGDGLETADLAGLEIILGGTATTADFDLTSDGVNNFGAAADITFLTDATGTSAEAIVIPQTLSDATLYFTTAAYGTFSVALTTSAFTVGNEYIYKATLNRTSVTISSPTINSWGDGDEGDDTLDAEVYTPVLPLDYSDMATVNSLLGESNSTLKLSNCYMVDPTDGYSIYIIPVGSRINTYWGDADYGGDSTLEIDTDWTTNDTYTITPLWNDFDLTSYDDQITFTKVAGTDDSYAMQVEFADGFSYEGNMVVAVKKGDTIVWSWHLWITDYNPYTQTNGTTYDIDSNGVTLTWMDRNIGARSTAYASDGVGTLYYQWGRKDPLKIVTDDSGDITTSTIPSDIITITVATTIADAVKAPDYFFVGITDSAYDWCGNSTENDQYREHHWRDAKLASVTNSAYGQTKSIYDPSPLGFMVPGSTSATTWSNPFNFMTDGETNNYASGYSWDTTNLGAIGTNGIFFPASGCRIGTTGKMSNHGTNGFAWSTTSYSATNSYSYRLYFSKWYVYKDVNTSASTGQPVRSIKE